MNIKHAVTDGGISIWYLSPNDPDLPPGDHWIVSFIINKKPVEAILHNESGPAFVMDNGYRQYRQYGRLFRIDGPVVVNPAHPVYKDYSLGEGLLTFDEWFELLTPEQQIIALYNPENF